MPTPINVGFIGLSTGGWAATALAPALRQPSMKDRYKLVAVSTTSQESAKASAENQSALTGNGVKAYFGSSEHIASDPDVDLVAVSVKTPMHKDTVMPVIEAGRDFFLEWPAGKNVTETREIAAAAKKHGVKSVIGLQGRHSATVKKIKEIIASDTIGPIRSVTTIGTISREIGGWGPATSERNRYIIDEANGATPLSIAIGHQFDILAELFGEFASVNATAALVYPTTVLVDTNQAPVSEPIKTTISDHYTIAGTFESGAFATIIWRVGYKSVPGRRMLLWEIDGEDGSLRLESDGTGITNSHPTMFLNGEKIEVQETQTSLDIIAAAWQAYADGLDGEYPTIEDAVKNQERLLAVSKSLKEGRTVSLSEVLTS